MSLELLAIDLGKRSVHCHGVDSDGVILSRKVSRAKLLGPPALLRKPSLWKLAPAPISGVGACWPKDAQFC